jgi:hypothetical protein
MDKNIRSAIARVSVNMPDGPKGEKRTSTGTGFLVAHGLFATALHVVGDCKATPPKFYGDTIELRFPSGNVVVTHENAAVDVVNDCVLLACPSVEAHPISLRELHRSYDTWETHGWTKMERADGMVVGGRVKNHAGELGHVPAIQLIGDELVPYGASANGLSGAPVLVNGAAVGLLRAALGNEDILVGATVYACPAAIVAHLSKGAVAVAKVPRSRPFLDRAQLEKVIELYQADFAAQPDLLETTVSYSFGAKLSDMIDPGAAFGNAVRQALIAINRLGIGPMEAFLATTVSLSQLTLIQESRIKVGQGIKTYCQEQKRGVFNRIGIAQLAHDLNVALDALSKLATKLAVRNAILPYRAHAETVVAQVVILEKYKMLHNCLHNLQFRLELLDHTLRNETLDDDTKAKIPSYAVHLDKVVRDARANLEGLPARALEEPWIDALEQYRNDLAALANYAATLEERKQILEDLRGLLGNASRINDSLAKSASSLQLVLLAEMMTGASDNLDGGDPAGEELSKGISAVGALRCELAGLVAEHFTWQVLSASLGVAAASSRKHLPSDRFPKWGDFKKDITKLCVFRKETWTILDAMETWEKSATGIGPAQEQRKKSNGYFEAFNNVAGYRFSDVDDALRAFCGKITPIAEPLNRMLAVLMADEATKVQA